MSRARVLTALGLGLASIPLLTGTANAGQPSGTMVATPNPATVGDEVAVSNLDDPSSTCEGGVVEYSVLDPTATEVDFGTVTPTAEGQWSISVTATMAGTWTISADCDFGQKTLRGESLQPFFSYADLALLVQAPGTTVPTTAPSTSVAPTTTAAAAATVTPAFTG